MAVNLLMLGRINQGDAMIATLDSYRKESREVPPAETQVRKIQSTATE